MNKLVLITSVSNQEITIKDKGKILKTKCFNNELENGCVL